MAVGHLKDGIGFPWLLPGPARTTRSIFRGGHYMADLVLTQLLLWSTPT